VAAEHRQPRLLLRRDDLEAMPVSRRTRSTNWRPLTARRQASVATERARVTRRRQSFSAQTASAATARSIARR
jgi:hypothetical protein